MASQNENSQDQAINFPELLHRVDNDRELMSELFDLLKQELPGLENSLREAVLQQDMEGVRTIGHKLKGMLACVSAKRAASAASRLEEIGNTGDKTGLQDALLALHREVAILLAALEAHAEKMPP
jgi:two-component system, sensor histidine kinase and response regulator